MKFLLKYYRFIAIFVGLALLSLAVTANTAEKDLEVNLGIEVGDDAIDYLDANDKVAKGQFVDYLIEVKNNNSSFAYSDVVVIMNVPDYMTYVPNSTLVGGPLGQSATLIPDIGTNSQMSILEIGYQVPSIGPGGSTYLYVQFQVDSNITVDPEYTLGWASLSTKYNAVPITSNLIETEITGDPEAKLKVEVTSFPPDGERVYPGTIITYNYKIHNQGGESAKNTILTTYLPQHTDCQNAKCQANTIGEIKPNEIKNIIMEVKIKKDLKNVSKIENTGYDLNGDGINIQNRDVISHPLGITPAVTAGDFWIETQQSPSVVMNSKDGYNARPDGYDVSDTEVKISHKGRQQYVWPSYGGGGGTVSGTNSCTFYYNYPFNSYFYAYNDYEDYRYCNRGPRGHNDCLPNLRSNPIQFNMTTDLPNTTPDLVDVDNISSHQMTDIYDYGGPTSNLVNQFMTLATNPHITYVKNLIKSRAIKNGTFGQVKVKTEANITESRWEFRRTGDFRCYYGCGRWTCSTIIPIYRWQRVNSQNVNLKDDAIHDISVLTSAAWLKTEGGHLGTNQSIVDQQDSTYDYNTVDLSYISLNGSSGGNSRSQVLSRNYTPDQSRSSDFADGKNSDYLIYQKGNTAGFESDLGSNYLNSTSSFSSQSEPFFLQKGSPYDRSDFPRDYEADLFDRNYYGEVRENKLPNRILTNIDVGNHVIWKNNQDIYIGQKGLDDLIVFKGGQARIYTTGNVYINANLAYEDLPVKSYDQITSVRIDANNIYIAPEVTDIEVMLLARNEFRSGEGDRQLRILGDVIAEKAFWERTPLLEDNPTQFNRPSEHIVEDYRKYIAPPPGDTQLPEERSVWRQVNPSTGEVLDFY